MNFSHSLKPSFFYCFVFSAVTLWVVYVLTDYFESLSPLIILGCSYTIIFTCIYPVKMAGSEYVLLL